MKVICNTKVLKEAVMIAERNTSKNQTLQVLSCLFIEASEQNKLKIKSTNLEIAVEINIPAKIESIGSIVLPAKNLSMFISNISEENIAIQNQNNNIFIKTQNTKTVLKGLNPEDFPLFPKTGEVSLVNFNGYEFKEALSSVIGSSSLSDIKPELASVYLRFFKNSVKFAATDSFRLSEKDLVSKENYSDKLISILIPQKSVIEILRIISEEEKINIGFNKNFLVLNTGSIKLISRLVEGIFPDYDQIIPKNFKTNILVKYEEFTRSIKIASSLSGRLNDINLEFDPQKKLISFYTSNSDIGEHNSEIHGEVTGDKLKVKYNWKYLFDGVSGIKSEYLNLGLNGDNLPMIIKGKGDNSFLYLIMPMRGV
ncbi:MAG: DNA polymerase III subunit beta [Patescibacteria group bacterium]